MKHNRDPESKPKLKLHKANSCGSLQSIPDLVSTFILTDLTGSFSRPKNPSKTCAPQGPPPVQLREYLFLHLFDCKPQNIVAVVVHESTAQEAVPLDGVAAQAKRNGDHFFGVEHSRKE